MTILILKIQLSWLQSEIRFFLLDLLKSHLKLSNAPILCHLHTINMMYQYCTPSVNII